METNNKNVELVNKFVDSYKGFRQEISKVIVGQDNVIDQLLMSIFCDGHSLLVGVPGLAKTLLVQTISECLGLSFNRIQFCQNYCRKFQILSEYWCAFQKFPEMFEKILTNYQKC